MREGVAHKKQSTLKIDKGRIERHIKPLIGEKRVKELTRGDIETMMYDIQKGDKIFVDEKTKSRGRTQDFEKDKKRGCIYLAKSIKKFL